MRTDSIPAIFLLVAFLAAPALAEKPDHAGGGNHAQRQGPHGDKHERKADKHERKGDKNDRHGHKQGHGPSDRHAQGDGQPRHGAYFDDRHRESVRRYYTSYSGKNCPPGLARKHNGCMPPGQAKKWEVGHRVPQGVTVYAVPQPILVTLPPPPPRHKYVRVSGDILLVAVGSQMVVDGISGLLN